MARLKVAHIITEMVMGGAQDNTLLTIERHNREKYEVALVTSPGGEFAPRARESGARILHIDSLAREISPLKDVQSYRDLLRLLRTERFDIVHTHSSKAGFLGRFAASRAGVPVIVHTVHGLPFHEFMSYPVKYAYVQLERFAARRCHKLLSVSERVKDEMVDLGIAPASKIEVVYSGIDCSRFDKQSDLTSVRRELGLTSDDKVVGFVGRLSTQKAPDVFLHAARRIRDRVPRTNFVMVGDGPLRPTVEQLVKELDLANRTRILGVRHDVPRLMRLFDVVVFSSRWEGLGRALTEALYLERPVVATAVNGVPELIEDGISGRLVPPNSPELLADATCNVLGDPDGASRMAQQGRRSVVQRFSAKNMVQEIESVYEDLAAGVNSHAN